MCVCDIYKLILKFTWKCQGPRIAQMILKIKNKIRRLILPDFKIYYKDMIINKLWKWHKNRLIDEWNNIEKDIYIYGQIIFDKGVETI